MTNRIRPGAVYALMVIVGAAAFLYPFWLPSGAVPNAAHRGDAPLVAALVGTLVVGAVLLEIRRGTLHASQVAILGVLSAIGGMLRLLDLPGGGNGIYFLVILAGAAFGARFGLLLGMSAMAVGAVITGGVGPWLPFQMLALGWMGAGAGLIGRATQHAHRAVEVICLAAYGWVWGFLYGGIMNLWFWPFQQDGGALSWRPGLSLGATLHRYWSFYVATSLGWDAAGALANVIVILVLGVPLLRTLRRFSHQLDPVPEFIALAQTRAI